MRKVWEKSINLIEERIYLGGFEIYRRRNGGGTVTLERETLHIMDDERRIALIETRSIDTAGNDPAPQQLIRYQFSNHLGSASLELDNQAQIISYEEYTPYGSTSYQAVRSQTETPKRYRYTGKERDEETGLYYHGARYYVPWLGRWISPDPIGLKAGTNVYRYVHDNPIRQNDPTGTQAQPPDPNKLVIRLPETFQINLTGGGSTGSAQFLTIAPHGEQGRAIRDLTGARLSESEHIWARYFIAEQLRDPATGVTPYNTAAYEASPTLLWTRGEAVVKTYGAGADDPFVRQIRQALKTGTPPSPQTLQGASFEAAVQRSLAAASGPTGEVHVLVAAHGQLGLVHKVGKAQPIPSELQGITDAEIDNALNALVEKPPTAHPPPPSAPPPPPPPSTPTPARGLPRPPRVNVGQIGANLPKALKLIGTGTTLLGAVNTARKVEANVAPGPGGFNKTCGSLLGLFGGIAAGVIDDALAVGLGVEGSPVIFEHWMQHGAGPAQTLFGEALIEFDYQFNRADAAVTNWLKSIF